MKTLAGYSAGWCPGENFVLHSFSCFDDLKLDKSITMAPRMVSFNSVFCTLSAKVTCF